MATKKRKVMTAKRKRSMNGAAQVGDNSLDAAKECLKAVEEWHEFIATEKGKYLKRIGDARIEISGHYAAAKERGVNTKALKALVKTRALEHSKQMIIERLDIDQQATYGTYHDAVEPFETTPLGSAAASADADVGGEA